MYGKDYYDFITRPNPYLNRQSETAPMINRPRNTTDEMLAVVNAQKQGLNIEVARRSDFVERFAPMTNPSFNFMDFRYRVKREPRVMYARMSGNAIRSASSERSVIEGNVRRLGGTLVRFEEVLS